MDYIHWRNDIFGTPPDIDPISSDLPCDAYTLAPEEALDHINRALIDTEIHNLFSRDQIGVGLEVIYCNTCSDLADCYFRAGDDARRAEGIRNLRHLYTNFFDRYCTARVKNIGNNDYPTDRIGYLCYMFWDLFILYPGNASPAMVDAALDVMARALESENGESIISAIHGLGHWAYDRPQAKVILRKWLRKPTTRNKHILAYAKEAATGCIL